MYKYIINNKEFTVNINDSGNAYTIYKVYNENSRCIFEFSFKNDVFVTEDVIQNILKAYLTGYVAGQYKKLKDIIETKNFNS